MKIVKNIIMGDITRVDKELIFILFFVLVKKWIYYDTFL